MPTPERVQAYKHESTAEGGQDAQDFPFPTTIDPQQDALESAGLYIQDAVYRDYAVLIKRSGNDMSFTDPTNGTLTLAQLRNLYEFLLETDPPYGASQTLTYAGGRVTREDWVRTAGSLLLKRTDYTYTGGRSTSEVRKVYDAATGTTVVAQLTLTYNYSGGTFTGTTQTRDV